jgi:hypothetical protein
VFKLCSELAATRQFFKVDCAIIAACMILAGTCDTNAAPATGSLGPAHTSTRFEAAMTQQLQMSKLLEHLPTLITDAALQLQAVAGVWPASVQAADKARFEPMLDGCASCGLSPGKFAEDRAYMTYQVLKYVDHDLTSAGSELSADRLPATQHLVLATWQYLSTILPDRQCGDASRIRQGSSLPTATQQRLGQVAITFGMLCTRAVDKALEQDPSISASAGTAPAGMRRTPQVMTAHAAVLRRHHLESASFSTVILQLMLKIKAQQQESTTSAGQSSATQQSTLAVGDVPAPLGQLLQQLGVSISAAVWAATQRLAGDMAPQSCWHNEVFLIDRQDHLVRMQDHSKAFLLSNPPPSLTQPLLQELQQQLQLYSLLSTVQLQRVVDDTFHPSGDGFTFRCIHVCDAVLSLNSFYQKVMYDGPASLHQHITGQTRAHQPGQPEPAPYLFANPVWQRLGSAVNPGAGPAQPEAHMCLPADVHTGQQQLLGKLVAKLLQTWTMAVGIVPQGQPSAASHTTTSTDSPGDSGCGAGDSDDASSSSDEGTACNMPQMAKALTAVGSVALNIAYCFPAPQAGPTASYAGGSASTAAAAAGQLCALLESLCRMEMAMDQHFSALQAEEPSSGRLDSSSSRMAPQALWSRIVTNALPGVLIPVGSRCLLGPLVDPIIAHSSPGSKPCKQLCSLLATMLKVALHDCCAPGERPLPCTGIVPIFMQTMDAATKKSFSQSLFIADHPSMCVAVQVMGAVIEAATGSDSPTTRQAAHQHWASAGSGSGASGRSNNTASPSNIAGVMSLLALLGRCCLLTSGAAIPSSLYDGFIEAGIHTKLDPVMGAASAWLMPGSNAAQLEALGYDTGDVLQCLADATAGNTACSGEDGALYGTSAAPLAGLSQLRQQLLAVGWALTSFAHPGACNNPACKLFSGPSKSSLVQGSTNRCSSCRAARYCSKSCQRAAWKQHRPVCKALTAASAAATAVAGKNDAAV